MSNSDPRPDSHHLAIASTPSRKPTYVVVSDLRPAEDSDTCLRPIGLCELGGSCDSCWYRPDHPRFRK